MVRPELHLPSGFLAWLAPYLAAFSRRTRPTAVALAVGALLTVGPRTVTNCLRALGLAEHRRGGLGEPAGIGEARRLEQVAGQGVLHGHVFQCWGPDKASPFGTGIGFRRQWIGVVLTLSAAGSRLASARQRAAACRTRSQCVRSASAALISGLACSAPNTVTEAMVARTSSGVTSPPMLASPSTLICNRSPASRAASRSSRL